MKSKLAKWIGIVCTMLCVGVQGSANAAVPPHIGYQGRLYDATNHPINGTLSVAFALYEGASGGSPVWTETQSITFVDGYFAVNLGSVTPFNDLAFNGSARFLGVKIGIDPEMTPRAAIASVPYALNASPDARFGENPSPARAGSGSTCVLGEIKLYAGNIAGATPAAGQMLSISQNQALFSLLGTKFGGNGITTFALPDLRSAAPNGTTYAICTSGTFPSPI